MTVAGSTIARSMFPNEDEVHLKDVRVAVLGEKDIVRIVDTGGPPSIGAAQ